MTHPPFPQKPIEAWVILIFGAIFLAVTGPAGIVLLLVPFFKPDEISIMSSLLTVCMLTLPAVTLFAMRRSYRKLKAYKSHQQETALMRSETENFSREPVSPANRKKLYWPWFVIAPGAIGLISSGPGALMFPIMPLFLAGMSTDSSHTPGYVPILLIFGGYGLMIGYGILLWQAIKALRTR